MLKAVFFDFNGTLYDDKEFTWKSIQEVFRVCGVAPPSMEEWFKRIGSNYMEVYYGFGIPRVDSEKDKDRVNQIRNAYTEKYWNEAAMRPDAERVIRHCKNIGLYTAIVSAETERLLIGRINACNLDHLFDRVRPDSSPKRPALIETLDFLNLKPSEAMYVDDTFEGNKAARDVGMISVGLAHPTSYGSFMAILSSSPDHVIFSLSDLIRVLRDYKDRGLIS